MCVLLVGRFCLIFLIYLLMFSCRKLDLLLMIWFNFGGDVCEVMSLLMDWLVFGVNVVINISVFILLLLLVWVIIVLF